MSRRNEQIAAASRKWTLSNPEKAMIRDAKFRAKQRDIPFDLSFEDIFIPTNCPVLGIPLFRGKRGHIGNSPSLDRLVPTRGYVKGNTVVISHRANSLKGNESLAEMELVVKFMRVHCG